jgi:hypothetical protein
VIPTPLPPSIIGKVSTPETLKDLIFDNNGSSRFVRGKFERNDAVETKKEVRKYQ